MDVMMWSKLNDVSKRDTMYTNEASSQVPSKQPIDFVLMGKFHLMPVSVSDIT